MKPGQMIDATYKMGYMKLTHIILGLKSLHMESIHTGKYFHLLEAGQGLVTTPLTFSTPSINLHFSAVVVCTDSLLCKEGKIKLSLAQINDVLIFK